jgi:hypothetical protein
VPLYAAMATRMREMAIEIVVIMFAIALAVRTAS